MISRDKIQYNSNIKNENNTKDKDFDLLNIKKVYYIGIGYIGLSAILCSLWEDKEISCDRLAEKIIDLKNKNILEEAILLSDHKITNGTDKLIANFKEKDLKKYLEAKDLKTAIEIANQNLEIILEKANQDFNEYKENYGSVIFTSIC